MKYYDIVLVDDDLDHFDHWSSISKNLSLKFIFYSTILSFLENIKSIEQSSNIFLDFKTDNSFLNAIEAAKILSKNNFKNIYLQTGHLISPPSNLFKQVRDKSFPFELFNKKK